MNPDPWAAAIARDRYERQQAEREAQRERLHAAAMKRRRAAKRGGRR